MENTILVVIFAVSVLWLLYRFFFNKTEISSSNLDKPKVSPMSPEAIKLKNKLKLTSDTSIVTIAAEDVLMQPSRMLKEDALSAIRLLCDIAKVIVVFHISCDAHEETIKSNVIPTLVDETAHCRIPLGTHRCIYYTTGVGKKAAIRQIAPHLHIDAFCKEVAPYIPRTCVVEAGAVCDLNADVIVISKLADIACEYLDINASNKS